eukprot:3707577-Prymnesium_polylepis.1
MLEFFFDIYSAPDESGLTKLTSEFLCSILAPLYGRAAAGLIFRAGIFDFGPALPWYETTRIIFRKTID